jgi:hypothetical protein
MIGGSIVHVMQSVIAYRFGKIRFESGAGAFYLVGKASPVSPFHF